MTKEAWGADNVLPRDPDNGLEDPTIKQWCYWDGQIIKAPDGKYHMFASRWIRPADTAGGSDRSPCMRSAQMPCSYKYTGVMWPGNQGGKGHNVTALVLPDKRFAVVVSETRPGDVFVSKSLEGPWEQLGSIRVDPNGFNPRDGRMSNVSIMLRPDGEFENRRALARSGSAGTAFWGRTNFRERVFIRVCPACLLKNLEDPVIWYSGGMYHIVVNCWSERKAFHLTSPDGIANWTNRGLAYDPATNFVRYKEGTVNHWEKMERPGVLLENGHVEYFTFAVLDVPKEQELGNDNHGNKNHRGAVRRRRALYRDLQKIVKAEEHKAR